MPMYVYHNLRVLSHKRAHGANNANTLVILAFLITVMTGNYIKLLMTTQQATFDGSAHQITCPS